PRTSWSAPTAGPARSATHVTSSMQIASLLILASFLVREPARLRVRNSRPRQRVKAGKGEKTCGCPPYEGRVRHRCDIQAVPTTFGSPYDVRATPLRPWGAAWFELEEFPATVVGTALCSLAARHVPRGPNRTAPGSRARPPLPPCRVHRHQRHAA